ncbi:uncharacterized protein LOC122019244 [Zingiber officinale]|uniref:uncharacterized protein LOC122019244 n=1 Tax=Zingiber officinale TaxID=94328 RepID=UPI001C4AF9DE|nr:uncharacterized protein LOC122019244 [Zingiber officinale]
MVTKLMQSFSELGLMEQAQTERGLLVTIVAQSPIVECIKEAQATDQHLQFLRSRVTSGQQTEFTYDDSGILYFCGRLCVPESHPVQEDLLREAHRSRFAIHPGGNRMYRDLKRSYWWNGMKKDIATFVAQCLVEIHDLPLDFGGVSSRPWVRNSVLVLHFTLRRMVTTQRFRWHHSRNYMAEHVDLLLYGTRLENRQSWGASVFSEMQRWLTPSDAELVDTIRRRMSEAQDRQKSYADRRRRPLEFSVDDHVFLRVSPTKGVRRFGLKGKLAPRYIGPFQILERIGEVAYRLALPPSLAGVHDVFHVSMLRKYVPHPTHILTNVSITLQPDVTYEEVPVQILDRKERRLRNKTIRLVKVG